MSMQISILHPKDSSWRVAQKYAALTGANLKFLDALIKGFVKLYGLPVPVMIEEAIDRIGVFVKMLQHSARVWSDL